MAQGAAPRQEHRQSATVWQGVRLGFLLVGLNGVVLCLVYTVIPSGWLHPTLALFGSASPLLLYLPYPLLFFLVFFFVGVRRGRAMGEANPALRMIITAWVVNCLALLPFTLILSFVLPDEAGGIMWIWGKAAGGLIVLVSQVFTGLGGRLLGEWAWKRFLSRQPSPWPEPVEPTLKASPAHPSAQHTPDELVPVLAAPVSQDEPDIRLPSEHAEPPRQHISRRAVLRGGMGLALAGGGWYGLSLLRRDVPLLTYRGHANTVYAVAWSPDGTRIASGDFTGSLHLWSPLTGARFASSKTSNIAFTTPALAWSPDGKYLVCSNDAGAQVLDGATLDLVLTKSLVSGEETVAAWAPDGGRIASNSDQGVHIWEAFSGQTLLICGTERCAYTLAWSADGTRLAADASDQEVQVLDATTGQALLTYQGHTDSVYSVTWSPDGRRIASGSRDTTIQVWDAITGKHLFTCQGDNGFVQGLVWSPDGRYLVSGGWGYETLVWDSRSGQLVETFDTGNVLTWFDQLWGEGGIFSVSLSPDGKYVVVGGSIGVEVWQI
jgi:WD40 repeat protein